MSNDTNDAFEFGSDPLVTPSASFTNALRERLEVQTRIQSQTMPSSRIVPYLAVSNAQRAIEFYASVFGAVVVGRPFVDDAGLITHAELNVHGITLYLSDEFPEAGILGPQRDAGSPVSFVIGVADADLCMSAAIAGGGTVERPVQAQWDSRSGWFIDPFGHRWSPTSQPTDHAHQGPTP